MQHFSVNLINKCNKMEIITNIALCRKKSQPETNQKSFSQIIRIYIRNEYINYAVQVNILGGNLTSFVQCAI